MRGIAMRISNLHKTKQCFQLFEHISTTIDILDDITKRTNISAMIIGGAALPKYNYKRTTEDIDVVTSAIDAQKLANELEAAGFQFIGHNKFKRGELEINLYPEGMLTHPQSKIKFPATEDKSAGLHYVSLPRLLALKISAGRLKDRGDYAELIKINNIDQEWIEDNVIPLLTTGQSRRWAIEFWKIAQKELRN